MVRFEVLNIPTTLLEVLIWLAFLIQIVLDKKLNLPKNKKIYLSLGVIVLAGIISSLIVPDKNIALGQLKAFIIDPIIFAWLVWRTQPRISKIRPTIICDSLIISSTLMAILAICQKSLDITTNDGRIVGIFSFEPNSSANYLAMYLAPAFAVSIFSFVRSKRYKIYYLIASILIMIGVYLTGSRGAILADLIAVLVVLWQYLADKNKISKVYKIGMGIGLAVLLLITTYLARVNLSAQEGSGRISNSNNIRYEIWKTTFKIETENVKNFFLGVGLGNYQNYFTNFTADQGNYPEFISPRALMPHNLFLSFWVQGGLLMLFTFIYLIILAIIKSYKNRKYQILAGLLTIIIIGLVDTPYWKNDLVIIFWIFLTLGIVSKP